MCPAPPGGRADRASAPVSASQTAQARNRGPASAEALLAAHRPVDELADEVGVPVVPGVLLDHVGVDPPQRAVDAPSREADVVERPAGGRLPAGFALRLPRREVGLPISRVEWEHVAVLVGGIEPEVRDARVTLEHPAKPRSLDLRHVPYETVQRELRTG